MLGLLDAQRQSIHGNAALAAFGAEKLDRLGLVAITFAGDGAARPGRIKRGAVRLGLAIGQTAAPPMRRSMGRAGPRSKMNCASQTALLSLVPTLY